MKTTNFTYLLGSPEVISEKEITDLERVLSEFPYFQSAAALRLKGLQNQNDFRYNSELKKTASQTTSRTILYDLITAKNFSNNFLEQKNLYDIEVIEPEIVVYKPISEEEKRKESILFSIETSETESLANTSGLEKLSFTQWLELTQKQAVVTTKKDEKQSSITSKKLRKLEIIDKFIEANPKITPNKNTSTKFVLDEKPSENTRLMTETLAEVYLKQEKYQKAIEAYEILILKYPKKSSFFVDRIDFIKKIQQNNI